MGFLECCGFDACQPNFTAHAQKWLFSSLQ